MLEQRPAFVARKKVDGMNLCAECFLEYSEGGKLIDKTKNDEDGEPCMED